MVLDYPDWSRVASGSLRSLGKMTRATVGTTVASFTITPAERSLVFVSDAPANSQIRVGAVGHTSGLQTPICSYGQYTGQPVGEPGAVLVNAAIDTQWDVTLYYDAGVSTVNVWAFASTDAGPTPNPASSQPVIIMVNGNAALGQAIALNSIPVVQASDAYNRGGSRQPYDQQGASIPGANAAASASLTATPGKRWIVDYLAIELRCGAAAAGAAGFTIVDGVTTIMYHALSIGAVANAVDRAVFGPGLGVAGAPGDGLTITVPAGGVNTFVALAYGAYLVA